MLTEKQIKKLPKGYYPNWLLRKMFPKQQGKGKSSDWTFRSAKEIDKLKKL